MWVCVCICVCVCVCVCNNVITYITRILLTSLKICTGSFSESVCFMSDCLFIWTTSLHLWQLTSLLVDPRSSLWMAVLRVAHRAGVLSALCIVLLQISSLLSYLHCGCINLLCIYVLNWSVRTRLPLSLLLDHHFNTFIAARTQAQAPDFHHQALAFLCFPLGYWHIFNHASITDNACSSFSSASLFCAASGSLPVFELRHDL